MGSPLNSTIDYRWEVGIQMKKKKKKKKSHAWIYIFIKFLRDQKMVLEFRRSLTWLVTTVIVLLWKYSFIVLLGKYSFSFLE